MEDDLLIEYRSHLLSAREASQTSYDKYLISLSGGALGISFVFIRDFIGDNSIQLQACLVLSWVMWTISIALVLFSFLTSRKALDKAIAQVDKNKVYDEHPGGLWDRVTSVLNWLAGICFLIATISIIFFIINNLRS